MRSFVRLSPAYLCLGLAAALAGCGQDAKPAAKSTKSSTGNGAGDATNQSGDAKAKEDLDAEVKVAEGSSFALFCQETADLALKDDALTEFRDGFCAGDAPKALLAKVLPAKAYAGSGEPVLLKLKDVEQDAAAKTTAITVASAVKLNVKAKAYFDGMTKFADDPAGAKAQGVALIDGVVLEENLETYASEGAPHVKGWEKHIVLENKLSGQTIKSEYKSRQDHYELVKGKVYLFAVYLSEPIKGVKENVLLAALLDEGDATYVLAEVRAKADNRGVPDVAKDTLVKIAKAGLKNVFGNAAKLSSAGK